MMQMVKRCLCSQRCRFQRYQRKKLKLKNFCSSQLSGVTAPVFWILEDLAGIWATSNGFTRVVEGRDPWIESCRSKRRCSCAVQEFSREVNTVSVGSSNDAGADTEIFRCLVQKISCYVRGLRTSPPPWLFNVAARGVVWFGHSPARFCLWH